MHLHKYFIEQVFSNKYLLGQTYYRINIELKTRTFGNSATLSDYSTLTQKLTYFL